MNFDPEIWGPHYWFFLHTISESYPLSANSVTKKKYYDLIQNFPLFIPNEDIGNNFSKLIDKYPVSPYLDKRESFTRWVHFIHNKVNILLDKPYIRLEEALQKYRDKYKQPKIYLAEKFHIKKHYIIFSFILIIMILIFLSYKD
jgi:hypothetical protein